MSATATAVRPRATRDNRKALAQVPEAFRPLYTPARYKVLFGGRGAGKSHAVATYVLSRAVNKTVRILCCRELQTALRDSVHKLLCDQITALRIDSHFEITQSSIRTKNGSEFIFEGLKHNVSRIKSLEGCDICWVEEAQTVSHSSWEVLIPTIRKEGSEIIVTMNPELATDASYVRFITDPPPGALLMPCSFADNRFFPQVLADEMELLRQRDPDAYAHVWLGHCRQFLAGAIYANELRAAEEQGRITDVPYDPTSPVSCYFDLGWADCTSIWIVQHLAGEVRMIDFIQDQQRAIGHYLHILRMRGYNVQTVWLPHDSRKHDLGTGRSIEEMVRADGWHVRITPNLLVPDGINALRTIFPKIWIDKQRCADGLQSLRHYKFEVDANTGQFGRAPLHDHASHASDAARYLAAAMQEQRRAGWDPPKGPPRRRNDNGPPGTGWMRG